MPRYLLVVRHSAVQVDTAVPGPHWLLSADGRSRCRTLAPQLKLYAPSHFITSHEPKAIETGQILAESLGVPCTSTAGLQEHDRSGVPFFANKGEFETAVAQFFARPDELVFGGETAVQATTRLTQVINREIAGQPEGNLAIVTHGTVLTLFICQYNPGLDPLRFWQALTMPCAFVLSLPERQLIQTYLTAD